MALESGGRESGAERPGTGFGPGGSPRPPRGLRRALRDEGSRDALLYFLVAVFVLELIVGVAAFFYGVVHAEPLVEGGPRMARFPWVGWLVAAFVSPAGLLLLLHLSGEIFSRSQGGTEGPEGDESQVPERFRRLYAVVRHAPAVVLLLGLVALGLAVLFVDSAMDMAMAAGAALKPHLAWLIGAALAFCVLGYLARLWFLARHRRMEREYEYRTRVLEKTGIVIMSKGCVPLRYEDGRLQLLEGPAAPTRALGPAGETAAAEPEVEDATLVEATERAGEAEPPSGPRA